MLLEENSRRKKRAKKRNRTKHMAFTSQDAILVQKPYKFTVKLNGHQITTTKPPVWKVMVLQRQNEW